MTDHLEAFPPVFATNRPERGETVAAHLHSMLARLHEKFTPPPAVAIATAYINPAGVGLLLDELRHVPHVRLLLGAEPEPDPERKIVTEAADRDTELDAALARHEAWLAAERDLMGFTTEASSDAQRLLAWLRSTDEAGQRRVEVRRFTQGFLHGKAYITEDSLFPTVLAGSSNFTYAGLMRNHELNLGYPAGNRGYVALVREWFEALWEQAEPYDLEGLYAAQWEPHTPWAVFLRMLLELYRATEDDDKQPDTELSLTRFQSDGVARMLRLLDELGGVLVADEVGLGKTFMAGEVIADASRRERQQVLIVCPGALRDSMWHPFLKRYDFSRRVDVLSYDDLRIRSDPEHPDHESFMRELDDYALVVVDEAHNLRNPHAQRSESVNALLGGVNPKKVVLLTATPVNNSLTDLHTLISYFVRNDAAFAGRGIPSIRSYVKAAQAMDPESLSPEHLFDLMDQVAVRRTRRFVKTHYPGDEIDLPNGQKAVIVFPTPKVQRIDYDLDPAGQALLDAVVYALDLPDNAPLVSPYVDRRDDPGRLMLARYTPSVYALDEDLEGYQVANAGLLRSALLKRLESSARALANTLGVLIASHAAFLDALDAGFVLTGEALREWTGSDAEDLEDWLADLDESKTQQVDQVENYHADALRHDVQADLEILTRLRGMAETACAGVEPKAARLVQALTTIAAQADRPSPAGIPSGDRRKVLVFSAFADTIDDLHDRVVAAVDAAPAGSPLAGYQGRIAGSVRGSKTGIDQEARARILAGFAPETAGDVDPDGEPLAADRFDLLFTTDVLSEGVNLQQCGRIINYDLPWNPMRLVQRHGRIDRIGSKHTSVILGCFFPAANLDKLLSLEDTLQRKLAYAEAAIGVGAVLPGQKAGREVTFADTREQIEQIREENPDLFEQRGGGAALSGEEYRRRLWAALADPISRHEVERLPYMAGSGFTHPNWKTHGYVFCMKMGTHPTPWFRWVPTDAAWKPLEDAESGQPIVDADTLTALIAADPGDENTERHLPDEAFDAAFTAWQIAREHAHAAWDYLTDPNSLMPDVPKALRDASQVVATDGHHVLNPAEQQDLLARLNTSPSSRVQRAVREALNTHQGDPDTLVAAIRDIVEEAGLQPPSPPDPLPSITDNEIHLMAWMAVSPAPSGA